MRQKRELGKATMPGRLLPLHEDHVEEGNPGIWFWGVPAHVPISLWECFRVCLIVRVHERRSCIWIWVVIRWHRQGIKTEKSYKWMWQNWNLSMHNIRTRVIDHHGRWDDNIYWSEWLGKVTWLVKYRVVECWRFCQILRWFGLWSDSHDLRVAGLLAYNKRSRWFVPQKPAGLFLTKSLPISIAQQDAFHLPRCPIRSHTYRCAGYTRLVGNKTLTLSPHETSA
jgi:hypothetical protein